ncbi:2-succinyl-6-hydroxy-2,4-cyclohexadiene-1-carboxylate synthase [Virgibacillus ainsalahensis]
MYFSINDASYWYEIHGEGRPVVLLHGFTGSSSTWTDFISMLQNNFKIISIDLPGHGKTKTPTPKSMEACCHDLKELVHYIQLEKFHLLGYSLGGRTALSFAMLYPEAIQSLILESASPGLATKKERQERIEKDEQIAKRIENEDLEEFVNFWEKLPLFDTQKKLPRRIQRNIRHQRLAQTKEGLAQSLRNMGTGVQPCWWHQLESISNPVLLLVGEHDHKFTNINKNMEKDLKNARFEIVENVGHAIHVEKTEVFGKLVMEFILSSEYSKAAL